MRVRRLAGALAAGVAAGAGLAAFAWRASKQVELSEVVVPVVGLPAGLDGLRILHIADTHFPANGESLERFLQAARGRNYDLVVATGDYADTADGWPVVVEAFRQLDAKLGVYASLGGHERYPGLEEVSSIWMGWRAIASRIRPRGLIDPAPLIEALEAEGVRVLVNENLSLEIAGELVRLIAVDDAYMDSPISKRLYRRPTPEGSGCSSATPLTACCTHAVGRSIWRSAGIRTGGRSRSRGWVRRCDTLARWAVGSRRAYCGSAG